MLLASVTVHSHETPHSHYLREGVLPILAASVLWAFVYFFRKTALYGISPPIFTLANSLIGALSLFVFCRLSARDIWQTFRAAPLRFLLLGLTGVSLGTTLMIVGLDHLDLGVALVLEKLQPLFTCLFAAIFLRERIGKRQIPWVFLALGASYFVSAKEPWGFQLAHSDRVGISALVGAAFCWGISSVVGRSVVSVTPDFRKVTFLRFVIGALFLSPLLFFSERLGLRFHPDSYVLSVIVLSSIFGSTLGYVLFYKGLRHVSASVSGFLELLTPVVGIFLGMALLQERLSGTQLVAIPLMLVAVYQLSKKKTA